MKEPDANASGFFLYLVGGDAAKPAWTLPMNYHRRRQLITIVAILATVAVAAKFIKAIYRGEVTQSRVKPLN